MRLSCRGSWTREMLRRRVADWKATRRWMLRKEVDETEL